MKQIKSALKIINRLSADKLHIVKEYAKLEAEGLPSYRKEDFSLNNMNVEKYARTREFISRFEPSNVRENNV